MRAGGQCSPSLSYLPTYSIIMQHMISVLIIAGLARGALNLLLTIVIISSYPDAESIQRLVA